MIKPQNTFSSLKPPTPFGELNKVAHIFTTTQNQIVIARGGTTCHRLKIPNGT